ncbi:MAG TPA: OmpA family protein [Macromonas sp.]|nr:OmpA family protein [Macromonas sp.]
MSDSLLHQMMRKAAPPPPPALPPEPPRRTSIHGGRYSRWHTELEYAPEEEGWMITYLDVVTLLLVMMVVMLAFAKPGQNGVQGKQAEKVPVPVTQEGGGAIVPPLPLPFPQQNTSRAENGAKNAGRSKPGEAPKGDSGADPKEALSLGQLGGDIKVTVGPRSVSFRISSELLFSSGGSELTPAGQQVVDQLLPVLNKAPDYDIVVEGHTDNLPIQTARFPSNWELAAARSGSVVRHLQTRGLNPTRLRATGLADTHPLGSNATAEGRAANRRVEITMMAPQPPAGQ